MNCLVLLGSIEYGNVNILPHLGERMEFFSLFFFKVTRTLLVQK